MAGFAGAGLRYWARGAGLRRSQSWRFYAFTCLADAWIPQKQPPEKTVVWSLPRLRGTSKAGLGEEWGRGVGAGSRTGVVAARTAMAKNIVSVVKGR